MSGAVMTYLQVDRYDLSTPNSLPDALEADWKFINDMIRDRGGISPLDFHLSVQGGLDANLGIVTSAWARGEEPPKDFTKAVKQNGREYEKLAETFRRNNNEHIDYLSEEGPLNVLAEIGLYKISSELNPRWQPLTYESWIRRGAMYATMPLITDYTSRKRAPFKDPSPKLVDESMLRLSCVSHVLRQVRDRMLETPNLTHGQSSYIKGLDGLLAEYDALLMLYEEKAPLEPSIGHWHFAAPPNMDFGPANKQKADIVSVRTSSKPDEMGLMVFDIKLPPAEARLIGQTVLRLTSRQAGIEAVNDKGKLVGKAGLRCDAYLKEHIETFDDPRVRTPKARTAFAMAILGEQMVELHHGMHMISATTCELPPMKGLEKFKPKNNLK